jgi:hypothetical protein
MLSNYLTLFCAEKFSEMGKSIAWSEANPESPEIAQWPFEWYSPYSYWTRSRNWQVW